MDFFISNAYAQGAAAPGGSLMGILPLLLMLPVFYFLMIRPQQKRMKEHKTMVAALKKGDEVVTNGGLGGTVSCRRCRGQCAEACHCCLAAFRYLEKHLSPVPSRKDLSRQHDQYQSALENAAFGSRYDYWRVVRAAEPVWQ